MRNDMPESPERPPAPQPAMTPPQPLPPPPLLILAADQDVLCTDELCLPAGARGAQEADA